MKLSALNLIVLALPSSALADDVQYDIGQQLLNGADTDLGAGFNLPYRQTARVS